MTTVLAIHAYALHRGPIWRSDAWAAPDHHLHIEAPAMTGIDYRIGDTRDVTATIPTGSVSLVATSPPFLALRSYLPADHPDKHAEIGSEPDPATFIDTLLGLTAEWGRVLAPWGSIAIELGDTYTGGGGTWIDPATSLPVNAKSPHAAQSTPSGGRSGNGWPQPKSLALIPQLYAIALAYGRNPLTGAESPAGRWRVRNVIVWQRPNPAVGALGDKFRPSTSYIVVATRDAKRWFDLTAVRSAPANGLQPGQPVGNGLFRGHPDELGSTARPNCVSHAAGAPPLDCWFDEWDGSHDTWTITTQPSKIAHYAMWPAKLAERLVLSMCPAEVCSACGEPRRRVERTTNAVGKAVASMNAVLAHPKYAGRTDIGDVNKLAPDCSERETLGWTDCGCGAPWTPGTVLDPFAGTGTTLAVANLHGRNAIGIDVDARNRDLLAPRTAEVKRNLFGTKPEMPGQIDLFGAAS